MAATAELKLTASAEVCQTSGTVTAAQAQASFAAVTGKKNYVQKLIISEAPTGAITAVRATLTWTKDGAAQTLGIQMAAAAAAPTSQYYPIIVDFSNNPVEGDDNTAITLTVPSRGAGNVVEAELVGFTRLT